MSNVIQRFGQNLFGTIAGSLNAFPTTMDFIPTDANGGTMDIKGPTEASWMGLQNPLMQKYAYEFCYPLASVVDRLAEYDLTGEVEILRAKGKGKEDYATGTWADSMNKLLKQPNPLQSWEQFRGQQLVYKRIFGYCPVLPMKVTGFVGEYFMMVNLPPWCFDIDGIPTAFMGVTGYKVTLLGSTIKINKDDVFILEDSFHLDETKYWLLPKSRLVGLDMDISNFCAAREADNVLLKRKGPLGFISRDIAKDALGSVPLVDGQKEDLQNALSRYGLSWAQLQYVISAFPAKWNSMSYNVGELGTKETATASEKGICHRYNFPYILYEMSDSAYSANGSNAEKNAYTSNVIPNAKKDINKYNKFFKAAENNAKITMCFDDVPCLQKNKGEQATARKSLDDALKLEYDNDIITRNMWLMEIGLDGIGPEGDKYKSETVTVKEPVALPVGGDGEPLNLGA